jgi:hypothetical protein
VFAQKSNGTDPNMHFNRSAFAPFQRILGIVSLPRERLRPPDPSGTTRHMANFWTMPNPERRDRHQSVRLKQSLG